MARLSQKYFRFYIIVSVFVFLIGLISSYYVFRLVVVNNLDYSLSEEKREIMEDFQAGLISQVHGENVNINLILPKDLPKGKLVDKYRTVRGFDKDLVRQVLFRELTTYMRKDGQIFQIQIRLHLEPHLNNLFAILPYFIGSFILLMVVIYMINGFYLGKLFLPFYQILDALKIYDIQKGEYKTHIQSSVFEFKQLDQIALNLTERVHNDYKVQKEFIENSSHEFKTPLAIINNQLDLLIQSENLTEKEMQHIDRIYDAIKRLSNLNKNLTYLFKIENQHFSDQTLSDVNEVLEEIIAANAELYGEKHITITKFVVEKVKIKLNKTLLEILFNNLVNNAYKYATPMSNISVRMTKKSFEIINVADKEKINNINLFNRFVTSGDINSTGLGLTIVKKICDLNRIEITCTVFEQLFSVYMEFPLPEEES